jgi:molybdopterin synthase catalytic subunit
MDRVVEIAEKVDTANIYEELSHSSSGAICVFIGSVRDLTKNQKVNALFFEAYTSMAVSQMHKIADEALQKWPLNKVILKHAVGQKDIQEPVVVVGASSPHRDAAFEACRYLIDTLKERVPIWKKEFFENNEVWVTPNP